MVEGMLSQLVHRERTAPVRGIGRTSSRLHGRARLTLLRHMAFVFVQRRCPPWNYPLGFEFGIPIEVIEPALVQVIWRKQPPVLVQMMHRGLERHLRGPHLRLLGRLVAFAQIARRAGRDNVVPGGVASARSRQKMIKRQVLPLTAILAAKTIT